MIRYLIVNKITNEIEGNAVTDSHIPDSNDDHYYAESDFIPDYNYTYTYSNGVITNTGVNEKIKKMNNKIKNIIPSVNNIKVTTTSGKVFDGNETSQDRMVRAINIASISGQTETQWKLADNTIVMVTLDELKEALMLAGQEMSKIWLEQ